MIDIDGNILRHNSILPNNPYIRPEYIHSSLTTVYTD